MEEIWKDIQGYEGKYQVSNQGRVRDILRKGKPLLTQGHGDGRYCQVVLSKQGDKKTFRVHRLVAIAFLPPPSNPQTERYIDHIDNCPINNEVNNLRWVSAKANSNNPLSRKKQLDAIREYWKHKRRDKDN